MIALRHLAAQGKPHGNIALCMWHIPALLSFSRLLQLQPLLHQIKLNMLRVFLIQPLNMPYYPKIDFLLQLLQVTDLYFWNRHWTLTIFALTIWDRADRSCCSNQQFLQNDSDQKNILALFGTLDAPGGKFFWTVRKTVDRWWFL